MARRLIPATSHYMKVACTKNEHQMPLILTVSEGTVRIKHTCCTSDHSRLTCKFMDQKGRVPTWRDLLLDSFAKDLSRFALTFQFIHVFDCSSLCMWCLSAMHAHNENEFACMLTGRVWVRKEEKRKKKTVHTLFRILSFLTGRLLEYVLLSRFAAVNDRWASMYVFCYWGLNVSHLKEST